jgi:hypothetical protein
VYDPFSELYTVIGVMLLVGGLVAAFKIGAWVWLMGRIFHRPGYPVARPESAPAPSSADSIKKWLSVLAAVLGIVSTCVGLLKGCKDDDKREPTAAPYQPYQPIYEQPIYGGSCCTPVGTCPLMTGPAIVGTYCTCMDMMGNMAVGTICR